MKEMDPLVKNHVTLAGNLQAARSMVFVHGLGTDQTAWRDVAAAFERDYRIVLLDNVGAGRSAPEAYSQSRYLNLHAYAADLLEVCVTLKLRDAVLVGHSAGAMMAVLAALRAPERFSRLVLIGASPRYLNDGAYQGGFSESSLNALYSAVMSDYHQWANDFAPLAMANAQRPNLAQHFAATLRSIPADRALTVLCAIFQSDHRADVARLRKPTLLIQALDDIAVPMGVAVYLHEAIAASELRVIDAHGHLPHISAPNEVIAAMRAFV